MREISEKQQKVLRAIEEFIAEKKYSPTIRELGIILNLKSTSTVHRHVERLKRLGYISSNTTSPRTIIVLRSLN